MVGSDMHDLFGAYRDLLAERSRTQPTATSRTGTAPTRPKRVRRIGKSKCDSSILRDTRGGTRAWQGVGRKLHNVPIRQKQQLSRREIGAFAGVPTGSCW